MKSEIKTERVKITANLPAKGQDSIAHLIGKEFEVVRHGRDQDGKFDGTVSVQDGPGLIVLQRNEYQFI